MRPACFLSQAGSARPHGGPATSSGSSVPTLRGCLCACLCAEVKPRGTGVGTGASVERCRGPWPPHSDLQGLAGETPAGPSVTGLLFPRLPWGHAAQPYPPVWRAERPGTRMRSTATVGPRVTSGERLTPPSTTGQDQAGAAPSGRLAHPPAGRVSNCRRLSLAPSSSGGRPALFLRLCRCPLELVLSACVHQGRAHGAGLQASRAPNRCLGLRRCPWRGSRFPEPRFTGQLGLGRAAKAAWAGGVHGGRRERGQGRRPG